MVKQSTAAQGTMKLDDVVTFIPWEDLRPNPYQPESRRVISTEDAKKGWLSLERSGLIHYPVVRWMKKEGKVCSVYEVGDGWQRKLWYEYGCLKEHNDKYARIPCIVKELTDQQMADLIAEANGQRRDMNPIEWAEFYHTYLERFGGTQKKLAEHYGLSQGEIANTMRLLELPAEVKDRIISREITESHGRELLRLNNKPEKQKAVIEDIVKNKLPVAAAAQQVDVIIRNDSKSLDPKANSWQHPPMFDVKGCKDCKSAEKLGREVRCLDAECWNEKQKAATAEKDKALLEMLKKQGIEKFYGSDELKHNQWNFIDINNKECNKCARRGAVKHSYDDGVDIVCLDPACRQEKRKEEQERRQAEDKAYRAEQEKEAEKEHERIRQAVENCEDEKVLMKEIVLLLGGFFDETLPEWFGISLEAEEGEDEHDMDIEAELEKAINSLTPHAVMKKVLAGLIKEFKYHGDNGVLGRLEKAVQKPAITPELESIKPVPDAELIAAEPIEPKEKRVFTKSVRCSGCKEQKRMEFSFNVAIPNKDHWDAICPKCGEQNFIENERWDKIIKEEKSAAATPIEEINKDPFAGLKITTAQNEGEQHVFKLRKVEIKEFSLRAGAIKFLKRFKDYESLPDDKMLEALRKLPATPNIKLLIGMLEGQG